MSAERKQRLDAIGFVWDALESAWEEGFTALTTFKARESHCRVPEGHFEGTFKLGHWIRSSARKERKCLLNADSGWMRLVLFGIRTKVHGKKVLQH